METLPGRTGRHWSPLEILFCQCPGCGKHLPWLRLRKTFGLTASCCKIVWYAEGIFNNAKFHVRVAQADVTNVHYLSELG